MERLENRLIHQKLERLGVTLRDRRLVASNEYFTRGSDPTLPDPPPAHRRNLRRHIYGDHTRPGDASRAWQRAEIDRRRGADTLRARSMRGPLAPLFGGREYSDLRAVILHQTRISNIAALPDRSPDLPSDPAEREAFIRDRREQHRVDVIIAHFVVMQEGVIAYTHDLSHALNSVSYSHGIDIEFEGHYPHGANPDAARRVPEAALRAGRALVQALNAVLRIRCIVTHGQVQDDGGGKLDTCPGPDIWVNVGDWARRELDMKVPARDVFANDRGLGAQANPAYARELG